MENTINEIKISLGELNRKLEINLNLNFSELE